MSPHRIVPLSVLVVCWLAVPLAAFAASPCCNVIGIEASGVVTASENATGREFQFRVADKALLSSLHIGQAISADFATQKVSVDGLSPCCTILAGPPAPRAGATALPALSQPTVQSASAPAAQPLEPCCTVVANPALTGRLGRLVVAFPEGAKADGTNVKVFKANDAKDVANGYGNQAVDLLPGAYAVTVNGKRVEGVTIEAGHDTRVKVGVLRVVAGDATNVKVLDSDQKTALTNTYGKQELGFPVGTVYVSVAGQSEAVTIAEGKITDF